jgi:phosphatidylserine decarboxylase
METEKGDMSVRQIAGAIARRIVCPVKEGTFLKKGEKFGMIKFGSRVELYLPTNVKLYIKVNDKVHAGSTTIGEDRIKC